MCNGLAKNHIKFPLFGDFIDLQDCVSKLSFDAARSEAGDHVFLYFEENQQQRYRREYARRGEQRPRARVVVALKLIQACCKRIIVALQQKRRSKKILVPDGYQHHYAGDNYSWLANGSTIRQIICASFAPSIFDASSISTGMVSK